MFLFQLFRLLSSRRKNDMVPAVVSDLHLSLPFLTYLYSAVYLTRWLGGDTEERVSKATMDLFGVTPEEAK